MQNRTEVHRELARRRYESQVNGYETGRVEMWYAPDGDIGEPYELTLFSPKRGDWKVQMADRYSNDSNPEFQMYWTGIPDFGIREYTVWPNEEGWIARMTFGGTALDGTPVTAHQVDIVTTDDKCRIARLEWYSDQLQWFGVWSVASGKPVDEVQELFTSTDGFKRLIAETLAGRDERRAQAEQTAG